MTTKSLWGDIPKEVSIKAPLSILREQAKLIPDITGNLLEGRVKKTFPRSSFNEMVLAFDMRIVAPALNNYNYAILSMEYEPPLLYPVEIINHTSFDEEVYKCDNEERVLFALKEILSSKDVQKVILNLMAQSKE